ncbi:MAG: hypothetical protein Q7R57_02540 [Dehalococcoidales bacterium]|nr:hypothetical protein [Dehalococcoidales bacterium]
MNNQNQNKNKGERQMKRKWYFVLAMLVALAVAGGSYAYTETSGSVSAAVSTGSSSFANVTTTAPAGWTAKYGSAPSWTPVQNTAGNITAGDLYYIDPQNYTGSLLVMVYLTNVGDLAHGYSYLNQGVNFYATSNNSTYTALTGTMGTAPNLTYYLTLSNGYVSFILPAGSTKGVITIDNGALYTIGTNSSYLTPRFYIDVRQA